MGLSAQRFPASRGGTSAVETAPKLGADPWLGNLRGERDVHVLIDIGAKVCLADVNEESFSGPALATVHTAPPPGCQVRQKEP
eukprot:3504808-Alexandrium_andersonii.AAC.1